MTINRTTTCEKPFITTAGQAYGCGQCLPCRLKKRREWTHRILLERDLNKDNSFVTLTYDNKHHPKGGTLVPADLRNWLKSFRKHIGALRVRYYAVGEYGEKSERPHYHLALFGWPSCAVYASPDYTRDFCSGCPRCKPIAQTWGRGFISNKPLEPGSARYVARYVIKKMTRPDDHRLLGRHPEFARMSLKPGIGAGALDYVVQTIIQYNLLQEGDVPVTLLHGGQQMPLGRYLRRKLRKALGRDEQAPQAVQDEINAIMLPLRLAARSDQENPSVRYHLQKAAEGKLTQILTRNKIFKTGAQL